MNHKNAVLEGLERMRQFDGHGNGLAFVCDGVSYTTDELIEEVRNNTKAGKQFSDNVYDMVLTYMVKFSQDVD